MIYLKIALALLLMSPSSAWCFGVGTVGVLGSGDVAGTPVDECDGMLICQNAEGGGYDNSETYTESGAVNEDYTTTVLRGTQSIYVPVETNAYIDITGQDEFWMHALFQYTGTQDSSGYLFYWKSSGGSRALGRVDLLTDGSLQLYHTSVSATATGTLVAGTTYHIWVHWIKDVDNDNTGEAELYLSTTTSRGTAIASITTGTDNYDAARFYIINNHGAAPFIFDQFLVSDSEFTTVSD